MIYTLVRKNSNEDVDAVISFDSVSSASESWSATVTTQTVERGFNITDNINIEPPTYDIEAIISSYSLFDLDSEIIWDGESFEAKGAPDPQSHTKARDELIRIFTERSILTIVESVANSSNSNLKIRHEELLSGYNKETNNCVITSLSISHPDSGTGAFYVSLKLQKIQVAVVTTIQLQEGEKTRTLKGLVIQNKDVSSTTSKETAPDGSLISPDETLEQDIKKATAGMPWEEGFAIAEIMRKNLESQLEAEIQVLKAISQTKRAWIAKPFGNGVWRAVLVF